MWQKLKKWGCYAIIIVLLPYVVTVFINGPGVMADSHVDSTVVQVQTEDGIVKMPIEEYCVGVLAKEIPASYEKEVLKAQAILVRTDVYKKIKESGSDTVLDGEFWTQKKMEQAWGIKYSQYFHKLKEAWDETEGQVLLYEDELALTPFFRLSNGCTRDAKEALGSEEYPYLKIVDCPEDIQAEKQIQTTVVDDMDAEVTSVDTAGYVLNVRVGKENVSGEEFRKNYHLTSGCFTLQRYNGKIRITTRGIGHGLGMSQYSANKMAKKGKTYQEILDYFFEGTEIKEVAEILIDAE
ncbi:MAG: SpoIID/LytB domain-containing protein [Dorea sp.]|nr:SpoIID/LytB domain-containing protein [Dorea sp.]